MCACVYICVSVFLCVFVCDCCQKSRKSEVGNGSLITDVCCEEPYVSCEQKNALNHSSFLKPQNLLIFSMFYVYYLHVNTHTHTHTHIIHTHTDTHIYIYTHIHICRYCTYAHLIHTIYIHTYTLNIQTCEWSYHELNIRV